MFTYQPFNENKAVHGKCENGTNTFLHISVEIAYIKKSVRYEMQHLMQIDELLLKF